MMEQEIQRIKDQEEERRRGTQLMQPGNVCVNQELVDIQISWLCVQGALESWFPWG